NESDDDCDGRIDEGIDLARDIANCGACGRLCARPNAETACVAAECQLVACLPRFFDVDGDPQNGCEVGCQLTQGGVEVCDAVDNDCDGRVDEGIDVSSDVNHCGGCGRACFFENAVPRCDVGRCVVDHCQPGFIDLDGAPGCEYRCTPSADGIEVCNAADDDCDGTVDEGFDLDADLNNCGRCGRVCRFDRASAACVEGDCRQTGCDPDWYDLDGDDNCEYLCRATGAEQCNAFDDDCDGIFDEGAAAQCVFAHAQGQCRFGLCELGDCAEGYVTLDDDPANGCEYACTPAPDGVEACNQRDDDCDGAIDERGALPPCALDRSGDFLVTANPDSQVLGGFLPVDFLPTLISLVVNGGQVTGTLDAPDGTHVVYAGTLNGDAMRLTANFDDSGGTHHQETWIVNWQGADRFTGTMTEVLSAFGFPLGALTWNVTGVRQ
ncbi:MAG: hypothetical protein KC620_22735, partial [Myxococcales bacterium]|nr:hypothetical protein [Myxococcales bacterium]